VTLGVTTSTVPVVAPAGTVAVISEGETTVKTAAVPLKLTLVAPGRIGSQNLDGRPTLLGPPEEAVVDRVGVDVPHASSVNFNGTPAVFTVKSASEITATVPAGATTGTVQVVTLNGTLLSNVPFHIVP